MAKINILDSGIYNKIAAGEVVERPASIVKELVENSIDAGADKIEIEIENGGLTSITVTDNGCGIEKDSVETAFLNHATSKITHEKDLESIHTLGFRGEALASIAAVTKLEITTKTVDDDFGTKLTIEGGKRLSKTEIGSPVGTRIKVDDLFFNTPARKKFLKKSAGETAEITNLLQRLALANPKIAFRYTVNGNTILNSQGAGLESAIYAVYGKDTLSNCKKINWFYKDIEVSGYVGNRNYTKPNRTYQTVIVNGRYVSNNTVCMAAQRAFERYLTTRSYPFFVLNINIPFEKVDVNVHPNKMEVKFEDPQSVFYSVYIPIKEMLNEVDEAAVPVIKDVSVQLKIGDGAAVKQVDNKPGIVANESAGGQKTLPTTEDKELFKSLAADKKPFQSVNYGDFGVAAPEMSLVQNDYSPNNPDTSAHGALDLDESVKVGVAFDTYVILQKNDDLYFIDQHAAHEMLLYDRFMEEYGEKKNIKQQLLVPFAFTVKQDEAVFINENLEKINECGFLIEEFGENSFKITEVPLMFSDIDFRHFVNGLIEEPSDLRSNDVKYIKEKLARAACKAAVKGGDKLADGDIEYLKKHLDKSSALRCPHGRPVMVKITRYEIEKWFKRVV